MAERGDYIAETSKIILQQKNIEKSALTSATALVEGASTLTSTPSTTAKFSTALVANPDLSSPGIKGNPPDNYYEVGSFCGGTVNMVVFEQTNMVAPTGVKYIAYRVWYNYEELPTSPCSVRLVRSVEEKGNVVYDWCSNLPPSGKWVSTNNKKIYVRSYDAAMNVIDERKRDWKILGKVNCASTTGDYYTMALVSKNYYGPDDELYQRQSYPAHHWVYGHCISNHNFEANAYGSSDSKRTEFKWSGDLQAISSLDANLNAGAWKSNVTFCVRENSQYSCNLDYSCEHTASHCSLKLCNQYDNQNDRYCAGGWASGSNKGERMYYNLADWRQIWADETWSHTSIATDHMPGMSGAPVSPEGLLTDYPPGNSYYNDSDQQAGSQFCRGVYPNGVPVPGCTKTCDSTLPSNKHPASYGCGTVRINKCTVSCVHPGVGTNSHDYLSVTAEDCGTPMEVCPSDPKLSKLDPLCP